MQNFSNGGEKKKAKEGAKKVRRTRKKIPNFDLYRMAKVALDIITPNVEGITATDFSPWMIISDPNPNDKDGVVTVILLDEREKERARCNVPRIHLSKMISS